MKNKLIIVLALLIITITSVFSFYFFSKQKNDSKLTAIPISEKEIERQDVENINKYEAEKNPKIPEYNLPIKSTDLVNLKEIKKIANISNAAASMLEKNGFVAIPNSKLNLSENYNDRSISSNFAEYYSFITEKATDGIKEQDLHSGSSKARHLPIFVTADSVLHYFHLMFNTTLIKLETNTFYDYIWDISKELYNQSLIEYNNAKDPIIKEAAKRNVGYFSVALNLLGNKESKSIYDSSIYKTIFDNNSCSLFYKASYCVSRNTQEIMGDRYKEVLRYLSESFMDGGPLESNIDKIIASAFKKYKLSSSADLIKMKTIQENCEKIVIEYIRNNNSMDVISNDPKYLFITPSFVKTEVDNELAKIEAQQGWSYSPLFIYQEDYSQYQPRAHYAKSEKLKKYFKAMMWFGRMTMLSKGNNNLQQGQSFCSDDGIISSYDAKIQTAQSAMINYYLSKDASIENKINKITDILDFLVGGADDLGPREYLPLIKKNVLNISDISQKTDSLQEMFQDINYNPKIYSGLGNCEITNSSEFLDTQAEKMLLATKGFRLFGQKFVPDSYWMSKIVYPYSGEYIGSNKKPFTWVKNNVSNKDVRGFPRGLDVASILGSSRADEIIKESGDADYTKYTEVMDIYKKEVKNYDENTWYKTIYNSWLYALTAMFDNFSKGYPSFMSTKAYQDKSLSTALASWTQLRHDTLLYVKQSYSMAEGGGYFEPTIVGYIEPIPELYIRLYNTSLIFKKNINEFLEPTDISHTDCDYLIDMLDNIIVISNKELRHEVLTEDEYYFIDSFAKSSERLIEVLTMNDEGGDIIEGVDEIINPIIIADVHTDGNTKAVLEEAVGKIRTGLFAYRAPQNNNLVLGIGPIFSYYEFKKPISQRMTDEQWRKALFSNNYPNRPEWVSNFYTQY